MQTITGIDLSCAVDFKVIQHIRIKETPNERYQIHIATKDNPNDEKALSTLRNREIPREWSNLDRLVRHIKRKYGFTDFPNILLSLHKRGSN